LLFAGPGKDHEHDSNLYTVDLRGNLAQLTDDDTYDSRGRWSPDGHKIAFDSLRSEDYTFYLMDIDGSNVRPVFEMERELLLGNEFVWAPNSQKLAVSIIPNDTTPINLDAPLSNIVIVDIDSKRITSSIPGELIRTDFSWSYDSNRLAYLSNPVDVNSFVRASTALYVFDLKRKEENLRTECKVVGTPVWSPIEYLIAFSAARPEETADMDIYLINSDGTGLKQLTNGGAYRVASWSPDGSKLAVEIIGEELTDHEIGVVDIKTGAVEQITNNDAFDAFPVWVELEGESP
jgi:TolB protein